MRIAARTLCCWKHAGYGMPQCAFKISHSKSDPVIWYDLIFYVTQNCRVRFFSFGDPYDPYEWKTLQCVRISIKKT